MGKPVGYPALRVFVADEIGQVKVVDVAPEFATSALTATWGPVSAARAVTSLATASGGHTTSEALLVARADGEVSWLEGPEGLAAAPLQPPSDSGGEGVQGVHSLPGGQGWVTVSASGTVRGHGQEGGAWCQLWQWQAACKEVVCSALDPSSGVLAIGGRGTDIRLHALPGGEVVFAGRGGRPNKLGLMDPAWNTAVTFLPPPPGAAAGKGDALAVRLIVGTGHHRVRLYDTAVGKRPQMDVNWGEARITALIAEPKGTRCWVANGQGQIAVLHLPTGELAGGIKGAAGSVRSLRLHPTLPILASVGLDRTLRLHSTASRQLLAKVYLKSQLTGVAFGTPPPAPAAPNRPSAVPDIVVGGEEEEEEPSPRPKSPAPQRKLTIPKELKRARPAAASGRGLARKRPAARV